MPETESQARPLANLEPEQQREAWKKAVETVPEGKVIAAQIDENISAIFSDRFARHNILMTKIMELQLDFSQFLLHIIIS